MKLPDFDEFLSAIDFDAIDEAMSEILSGAEVPTLIQSDLRPESLNAMFREVHRVTLNHAAAHTRVLLEAYHIWLQRQVSKFD